jgi:hypothetical protein
MKSKFFLVQTDVFLSICIILIINSMQSVSVFSALRANAGSKVSSGPILEIRVDPAGALAVTGGDTTCEQALVVIHPAAVAGDYENALNEFLAGTQVKSVARVTGDPKK